MVGVSFSFTTQLSNPSNCIKIKFFPSNILPHRCKVHGCAAGNRNLQGICAANRSYGSAPRHWQMICGGIPGDTARFSPAEDGTADPHSLQ